MLKAIEAYLALRRATGFAMLNAECLLRSFAAFATERRQPHVHALTAIEWAARAPSVAQRDARLKAVCRCATSQSKRRSTGWSADPARRRTPDRLRNRAGGAPDSA